MQIQLSNISPPANPAHGGNAGSSAPAGDASFSQLLGQAAPRETAQSVTAAQAPRTDRSPARNAAEQASSGDASQAPDAEAKGDEGQHASPDVPAVSMATVETPIAVTPAAVPVDAAVATWLATFAASVVAASDMQTAQAGGEAIDDALAARAAERPAANPSFGAPQGTEGEIHRKPTDPASRQSAAAIAQNIVHDAPRGAEEAATQLLRGVRAIELPQPSQADTNASANASLAAAGAHGTGTAASLAAPVSSPAPALQLPHPIGSAEFAPSLAFTLTRLARDGVQEARLQLHPKEMGPIDVRIAIDGTQARVDFSADVLATRSAIEAGLPQLASALRESGLTLAGGGVFQHARGNQQQGTDETAPESERDGDEADATRVAAMPRRSLAGVVDLYA